jgi:Zn-dependent protease
MDLFIQAIFNFTIFIIFATFHEYAHGWVANRCGDSTAKRMGRLSLNPIVHIDLMWTLILPIMLLVSTGGRFAIGAAKPVPVDTSQLKNPRRDIVFVSLAGPSANVIWAMILIFLMKAGIFQPTSPFYLLLFICMYVNIILLVFNLLPIPPLDGSRVLEAVLPDRYLGGYYSLKPYMFIIFLLLMFFGVLGKLFGLALYLVIKITALQIPLRWLQ